MKIGDVAAGFAVTRQTIRNWIKHEELSEFFTPQARRDTGKAQSELLGPDLEVCNSIHVMLRQKASWNEIAAKLRTGWRDTNLPDRLTLLAPPADIESSLYLMTSRAVAEQKSADLMEVVRQRDDKIAELEVRLERSIEEREALLREIGQLREEKATANTKLQVELDLWREGRLKPVKGK